jgi:hypothetical protein
MNRILAGSLAEGGKQQVCETRQASVCVSMGSQMGAVKLAEKCAQNHSKSSALEGFTNHWRATLECQSFFQSPAWKYSVQKFKSFRSVQSARFGGRRAQRQVFREKK